MVVKMTPGLCSNDYSSTGGTFCESCFASFVLHGCAPDRACITEVVDDGRSDITLILSHSEGQRVVQITDENREALAYGGWPGWVEFLKDQATAST
jgi:hypothetical protein